ncbi:MAG: hypothetical protein ACRCVL_01530 [Cetobacterium sp.]
MSISVPSINARGLRDPLKRKSLFLYCKGKGVEETHSCKEDERFWRSQWGNDIWFSHFSTRSAGVAILKGKFKGQVLSHEIDSLGRMVIIHVNIDQTHNDDNFKTMVSKLIDKHWSQAKITNVYGKHWEIMKYKIRNLAISMGKYIASVKRQKE